MKQERLSRLQKEILNAFVYYKRDILTRRRIACHLNRAIKGKIFIWVNDYRNDTREEREWHKERADEDLSERLQYELMRIDIEKQAGDRKDELLRALRTSKPDYFFTEWENEKALVIARENYAKNQVSLTRSLHNLVDKGYLELIAPRWYQITEKINNKKNFIINKEKIDNEKDLS